MLLSAVSVLVVAQSSSEIPEGLMNNPVYIGSFIFACNKNTSKSTTIAQFFEVVRANSGFDVQVTVHRDKFL